MIRSAKRETVFGAIGNYVHGRRYSHTMAVEQECAVLASLFGLSEDTADQLCCAALLHDITKEKSDEEQLALLRELDLPFTDYDRHFGKLFHARTAVGLIRRDFPECATDLILDAVRYHTVGREDMTLTEKLLYLADYIEPTRTFEDCVRLRAFFYDGCRGLEGEALLSHLDATLLLSYDMTIRNLLDEGKPVHPDTVRARNFLVTHQKQA